MGDIERPFQDKPTGIGWRMTAKPVSATFIDDHFPVRHIMRLGSRGADALRWELACEGSVVF